MQAHLELLCLETLLGRVGHQPYRQRWGWEGEKEEQISAGAVGDASLVLALLSGLVQHAKWLHSSRAGGGESVCGGREWCMITLLGKLLCSALSAGTERWWQSCT